MIWYKYKNDVVFIFATKYIFQIMICLADITFWMSNCDDFDNDQIS